MKIGIRTPSLKKSFKARTTGKLKRTLKKTVVPGYGKKGVGMIKDPKKAVYNKVYHQTTTSVFDNIKSKEESRNQSHEERVERTERNRRHKRKKNDKPSFLFIIISAILYCVAVITKISFFAIVGSLVLFLPITLKLLKSKKKSKFIFAPILIVVGLLWTVGFATGISKQPETPKNNLAEEQNTKKETPNKEEQKTNTDNPKETENNDFKEVQVTKVIDGDTVEVTGKNGKIDKVRFIGLDCPEKGDALSKEATQYTSNNLLNKTVYLQKDKNETDSFGRLLAYVWLAKTADFTKDCYNYKIVHDGYAVAKSYPPDTSHQKELEEAQSHAKNEQNGIWAPQQNTQQDPVSKAPDNPKPEQEQPKEVEYKYVCNTGTGKFHRITCSSVDNMNEGNKLFVETREDAINAGYKPCKKCNP